PAPVTLGIADCGVGDNRGSFSVSLQSVTGFPTPTPTESSTPLPTPTPTPRANGAGCGKDSECASTYCRDGVCCDSTCSAANDFWPLPGFVGTCVEVAPPTPTNTPTATPTETPTPYSVPQPTGVSCFYDTDCASGFCTDRTCCETRCAEPNEVCAVPGSEG